MRPVFVDPSVLLLAVGGEHPSRPACRQVLEAASIGDLRLHMSVEGGQEFLYHRMRRTDRGSAVDQFGLLDRLVIWHPFDADTLRAASDLVAGSPLRGRDAVHAATALAAGFSAIVSCDEDFDDAPGLERLDPTRGQV